MSDDLLPVTVPEMVAEVERIIADRVPVVVVVGRRKGRKRHRIVIDEGDLWLFEGFNWFVSKYLIRTPEEGEHRSNISFHKEVIGLPEEALVDHINGDPLDNRKANLRIATRRQNANNRPGNRSSTSAYKGVSLSRTRGTWIASIKSGNYIKHSSHQTEIEAALEYDRRAKASHGEFARLNFPPYPDLADRRNSVMRALLEHLRA